LAVKDFGKERWSSLPIGIATVVVRCAWRIPCLSIEEISVVSQLNKYLHVPEEQLPMEDLDAKENLSYQEYSTKILETSERVTQNKKIKSPYQGRSHMGKGRRVEGRVSKSLFRSVRITGMRFILRG
jgi:hypothetical protein